MHTWYRHITGQLQRFEAWFAERFGWFFTNGMKQRGASAPDMGPVDVAPPTA